MSSYTVRCHRCLRELDIDPLREPVEADCPWCHHADEARTDEAAAKREEREENERKDAEAAD